jgi:uncharacterized membrane protein
MFSFLKKKPLFTPEENNRIISAIRSCETSTSGEIRIYIEQRNPLVDPLERAAIIFHQLKMNETRHRNAVLLYLAIKDHEVALFGDSGIHEAVGSVYWQKEVQMMLENFRQGHLVDGIEKCIIDVGEVLTEKFPYISTEDKNELPDEIVFGK